MSEPKRETASPDNGVTLAAAGIPGSAFSNSPTACLSSHGSPQVDTAEVRLFRRRSDFPVSYLSDGELHPPKCAGSRMRLVRPGYNLPRAWPTRRLRRHRCRIAKPGRFCLCVP